MALTYLGPTGEPGKTTDATDVVDVDFDFLPSELVVHRAFFVADDPSYAGTTTMTWRIVPADVAPIGRNAPAAVTEPRPPR